MSSSQTPSGETSAALPRCCGCEHRDEPASQTTSACTHQRRCCPTCIATSGNLKRRQQQQALRRSHRPDYCTAVMDWVKYVVCKPTMCGCGNSQNIKVLRGASTQNKVYDTVVMMTPNTSFDEECPADFVEVKLTEC